jgi:hypothetical protein
VTEPHSEWPDYDAIALTTAALAGDYDAACQVLGSLDRKELIALCWVLARWHAHALKEFDEDPLATLQRNALSFIEEDS